MSESRTPQHNISILVDGVQVRDWESYEIRTDLLQPTDTFSVRMPFRREVWDLCRPDRPIKVLIDDVVILSGFIGERLVPENDESVEIVGRDRAGRLVSESAPGIDFSGLGMQALIEKLADPWFPKVTFTNARNRALIRGRGRKAKAASEPLKLFTQKKIGTHIEPGQTRWVVIETLCAQAGVLAWASGDGTELIVGRPNYNQEPQFRFFKPAADSRRIAEATVLGMGVRDSVEDRYSRVICVGSSVGTTVNYGKNVTARYADARNNPATPEGDGLDFSAPKQLIILRSPSSQAEARELAAQEMARRDAHGIAFTVVCPGHGQVVSGSNAPTIFAPDTIASCEDERTGMQAICLITSCTYQSNRKDGETTTMELVRSGSELSIA